MEHKTSQQMGAPTLGVMESVKAGYSLILSPSADILKLFVMMTVLNLLLIYVGNLGAGLLFLISVLSLLTTLPLIVFVSQKVVTGQASPHYLGYFGQSVLWKALLVTIVVAILGTILGGLFGSAIVFSMFIHPVVSMLLVVVGIALGALILGKVALLIPHVVVHNKLEIGTPLHLAKGNVLRLVAVITLTALPTVGVVLLMLALGMNDLSHIMGGMSHMTAPLPQNGMPVADAIEGTEAGIQAGSNLLLTLGKGIGNAIITYLSLITQAALAHAYKILKNN